MTYKRNIPKSQRSPRDSTSDMQGNFTAFDTAFKVNHTALNDSNEGKHEVVINQLQSSDPVVDGTWPTIYARNAFSQVGIQPQLFSRIQQFLPNKVTNAPIQLTYNQVAITATTPSSTLPYQSFLFGGYLIYFNQSMTGTKSVTITLSPVPTQILCVIAQPTSSSLLDAPRRISTLINSNTQFQIFCEIAGLTFQWVAIARV
jgi:hypothetical protein